MRKLFNIFLAVSIWLMLWSCASIGTPSGGPRDEDPPRFVRSNPAPGATNFNNRRVVITFDEIINVKDAFSKVVISPTSAQTPRVSSNGRNVFIEFQDSLRPNTTYTVDFGNAIEDNNEGNKLQSFSYTFSTGSELDTLRISGMVLAARDLEPQQGMLVGVYRVDSAGAEVADTTFRRTPLERIAKTDDRGRFTVRGLKPGNYRVFALADVNNDFRWDNPQEDIAFTSFTVSPTSERISVTDTIWDLKNGKVDSVVQRMRTRYLPNDILLSSFNINFKQQYLTKSERIDSTRISLIFNAEAKSPAALQLVGHDASSPWYWLERNATNDTLTYWIRDPQLIATDTLNLALTYMATDSAMQLSSRTDTLKLLTQRPRAAKKKNKEKVKKSGKAETADSIMVKPLNMTIAASASHDIRQPLVIEFPEPLERLDTAAFHLQMLKDSVWIRPDKPYRLMPYDSISIRKYKIEYPWQYGTTYKLTVDSLAATGIYGLHTAPAEKELTVKKESEYFNLTFRLSGLVDTIPCFVELLDGSDKPVRMAPVVKNTVSFNDIPLGTYYARLIEDINGNGIYDTGDYDSRRQPEYVYYYPKALKITKRWDLDQPWNILETAIDRQKPAAIKKNKPDADKRKRQSDYDEVNTEDEIFDPTANPFDPNDKSKRRNQQRNMMF